MIKMTKEQKNVFDEALAVAKDKPYDFIYFIDGLGMVDGYWPRTQNTPSFEKRIERI